MISRNLHVIEVDELNDEIVVDNGFADAILFFRRGANGEEAPIRVIQGPRTYINGGRGGLAVDPEHNEVFLGQKRTGAILVFPRDKGGDIAPLRIIHGPKTKLRPEQIAVDPKNNLLVVANSDPAGLLIFNRTDEGDVAPKAIITGPKTGFILPQGIRVDPERKQIIVAVVDEHRVLEPKPGFIGVWNYTDNGDVPPKAIIKGPISMLIRPRGVAINPKNKEIYVVDMRRNALFTFSLPQIF